MVQELARSDPGLAGQARYAGSGLCVSVWRHPVWRQIAETDTWHRDRSGSLLHEYGQRPTGFEEIPGGDRVSGRGDKDLETIMRYFDES